MGDHGFKLTSHNDLETIRASLMTQESAEAFSRLEFELTAWRLHRIVVMERMNQIDEGIHHNGELYIKFSDAIDALGAES